MTREEFENVVALSFNSIPDKIKNRLKNIAFLVESEPSGEIRKKQELRKNETLFGLYTGIPMTMRGEFYGVGPTMPDTITIFQKPIEEEASGDINKLRKLVSDTIWHEVAHYLGFNEKEVRAKEKEKGMRQ